MGVELSGGSDSMEGFLILLGSGESTKEFLDQLISKMLPTALGSSFWTISVVILIRRDGVTFKIGIDNRIILNKLMKQCG